MRECIEGKEGLALSINAQVMEKSATPDENVQFVKRYGYSKEVRSRQERNNTRILEWHLPR
jgi:hypothetical protein